MIWDIPIYIGNFKVKNRIVFPALSTNWAEADGSVNERVLNFYREIAFGGCGMIVVSGTAVSPEGKGSDRSLVFYRDSQVGGFARLAEAIKANDCLASIQLMHVGGQGNPLFSGYYPVSPSGVECKVSGYSPRPLTIEEIKTIRSDFINSAKLAYRAGFQALELHLAHGYLLHEFLSKHSNQRSDDYGGSAFNRLRLILEIIEAVKMSAPQMALGVRISAEDYLPEGINYDVNRLFLPVLEDAGVDYFSVTAGIYDTSRQKHEAMARGEFFHYARKIKGIVSQPVIGVGKILDLEAAESRLQNQDCDLVAIGRGLVADPMMISKTLGGEAINYCTECGECQYLKHGGTELHCPIWEVEYA